MPAVASVSMPAVVSSSTVTPDGGLPEIVSAVEMESLPTALSVPSRQNQQSDPAEETEGDAARRPESGGVVVALPALQLCVRVTHRLTFKMKPSNRS